MNLTEKSVKPGCQFIKKADNTMVTVDNVADFEKKYTKNPWGSWCFTRQGSGEKAGAWPFR